MLLRNLSATFFPVLLESWCDDDDWITIETGAGAAYLVRRTAWHVFVPCSSFQRSRSHQPMPDPYLIFEECTQNRQQNRMEVAIDVAPV